MPSTPPPATDPAPPLERTQFALAGRREGKVRDIYPLPGSDHEAPRVLIVATDRVSAFDVVLPALIPDKGTLLTEISTRWFDFVDQLGIATHHLISTDPSDVPGLKPAEIESIRGRTMIGRATEVMPVEFVVRGYLAGSGWSEYQQSSSVCGVPLPAGLRRSDQLPETIFTPSTKATSGHDEPVDFDYVVNAIGGDLAEQLRDASVSIYNAAAAFARDREIILADTKFEFGWALDADGRRTDEVILIDEVLTPDSSRYWPADQYEPGREQDSFDKQYVRNYLLTLVDAGQWDKTPPAPPLPENVVANTTARYRQVRDRLFGNA